jgi:hypothetical protein
MKNPFYFNNIQILFIVFILFFILHIVYFIISPQEVFAMDPYDFINSDQEMCSDDEDMYSDEDLQNSVIIARKEEYRSHSGMYTYNTRRDIFESYYPNGIVLDRNIINDSYDNEKYFDIPLTMIYGENKNIEPGIYYGCISRNIDGLLI